jgi:archaeoflavoprotein AfpA
MKIAWGITGGGDKLLETVETLKNLKKEKKLIVEIYLSKAGYIVSKYYKIYEDLVASFDKVWIEKDANTPFLIGRLQMKEFDLLLIAPATSNTVAKIAVGISDTLLSNAIIQGIKGYVPVYIMPTDFREGETVTVLPNGKTLRLRVRKEDVLNVRKLEEMDGISVLESPDKIKKALKNILVD